MRIVDGEHVDLISPFPQSEIPRAADWTYQYSTYTCDDSINPTKESVTQLLENIVETQTTYGIIDKNNLTKCEERVAPIVGIISFGMNSPQNGYIHIACPRKAWGKKTGINLALEASKLAVKDIFDTLPELLRISALFLAKNYPARRLAERTGFSVEGYIPKLYLVGGKPSDAMHYGILKPEDITDGNCIRSAG